VKEDHGIVVGAGIGKGQEGIYTVWDARVQNEVQRRLPEAGSVGEALGASPARVSECPDI
jgi:hypothetical protein